MALSSPTEYCIGKVYRCQRLPIAQSQKSQLRASRDATRVLNQYRKPLSDSMIIPG